jgi:hypothetical protein
MTAETPQQPRPEFITDDARDLATLLHRAANWAREDARAPTIAAEFQDAQEFVEDELVEGTTNEPRQNYSGD